MKEKNDSIYKETGKFVKIISGGFSQGWAFMIFESTEKKQKKAIYARKNVPELYKKYEITYEISNYKDNRQGIKLTSYIPVIEYVDIDVELKQHIEKIPKVGKITAKKIFEQFGRKFFDYLEDPEKNSKILKSVLSDVQIENSVKYYKHNSDSVKKVLNAASVDSEEYRKNIEFFYGNDLVNLYTFLKIKYQTDLEDFIKKYKLLNPYKLYLEDSYNLYDIDRFAILLGWNQLCEERLDAFIHTAFIDLEDNNSTYINSKEIVDKTLTMMSLEKLPDYQEKVKNRLKELTKLKYLINDHFMYCRVEMQKKEEFIVDKLVKIDKKEPLILTKESEDKLNYLSNEQRDAYFAFINHNVSIISGNPGTGKSSLIKHFYNTLKQNDYKIESNFFILAPTGRAASNLSSKGHFYARTIHSFLKIKDDKEEVLENEDAEKAKVIIIDEFSMVNINLFYKLLNNCPNLEKIVLLGDKDQLPAIGPGYILNDLINSKKIKTTVLEKFYRSDSLEIKSYVDFINFLGNYKDIRYIKNIKEYIKELFKRNYINEQLYEKVVSTDYLPSETNIFNKILTFENNWNDWMGYSIKKEKVNFVIYKNFEKDIVNIYKGILNKYGINDSIILCPMYKGLYGINKINNLIQKLYNPKGRIIHWTNFNDNKVIYKIGDKVIQLVNKYDKNISNGDIGYITDEKIIDGKSQITVTFKQGNKNIKIIYNKEEFNAEINLAYAITVHKFQGSETKAVMFIINNNFKHMLNRKLVYTAVSRAINEIWIFSPTEFLYSQLLVPQFTKEKEIYTNMQILLKD
ncbi:ATP-dependent DNA helicase [Mycoplasma sp. 4013]